MIDKFGNHVTIDELTAENYAVPHGEEKCYHCVIEVKQFNPKTGARISAPRIQKFGQKTFEKSVYDTLLKQGYDIRILWNPTEYNKMLREKAAISARERKEKEAEARKAEIDAAVAKAVAEALAAQKKASTTKKAKSDASKSEEK